MGPSGDDPGQRATLADPAVVRRLLLVMYGAGVFGLLCAIFGPDPDRSDNDAFWALIGVELTGAAILLARPRASQRLLTASIVGMAASICVCVAVARPTNGVPLYTIWPALLGAYAMGRRGFVLLLGATAAGLAVAIIGFVPPPARLALWLDTVLTVGFAALVARALRERLDALVGDLHRTLARVRDAARRDPLTGLPNRRAFDEALGREVQRARRAGRPLTLVLLDLDHFKAINDTHGHAEGDACLRRFADIARGELRPGDLLARIGGEEFALALYDADAEAACAAAERLAGAVRGATADDLAPLTVSGGVAELGPAAPDPDALLAAADRALYAAKSGGRRRVALGQGAAADVRPEVPASRPAALGAGAAQAVVAEAPLEAPGLEDDDRRTMRRVAVLQLLAGIPATGIFALLPGVGTRDLIALALLCGLLSTQAVALLLARRVPPWIFPALPFGGVAVISTAVAVNDPISGTPYFFVWPAVFSAYFFGRRHLTALLAVMAVAYAVVLALWVSAPLRLSDFTTVMAPVLVAAIVVATLRARVRALVDELRLRLADLERAATHDALTGLLNRRAFDAVLAREVSRAERSASALALVMVDVDHFKDVNDRFGHAAGDRALRIVAEVLRSRARETDVVARLGGEEFAVLLPGARAADATAFADEAGDALRRLTADDDAPLTVSAGVAEAGDGLRTTDELLVGADRAMYAAKGAGRDRTAVWATPVEVGPARAATREPPGAPVR